MGAIVNKINITRRAALVGAASLPFLPRTSLAKSPPRRGGTLNMLLLTEPLSLVALTSLTTLAVSAKVTEGLLEYGHDLKPRPQLATSWDVSPDGLRYTFKLRENVKWHDGKPFTSADVAAGILLLKKAHPRGRQTFANVTEVQTPDEHTAVIVLSTPVPYMLQAFAAAESPIVPKHLYDGVDPATNPVNAAPVGTGPFKFKEWVRGSHIVYERNPDYWDQPRPYVDRLVVRFVPDIAARSIALETGSVDLGNRTPVALSDLERLRKNPKLAFDTKGYEYSCNITSMQFNLENKYFSNPKVRQAIAHAIDRNALVRIVFYNNELPCPSPIVPTLKPFHDPSPSPYAFDLKKAEALLDQAGLPRAAGGKRFTFTLDAMPVQTDPKKLSEFLRASLSRIGIGVEIRMEDAASYIRRVYTDRQFDAILGEFSNLYDPIVGVRRLYWSKNIVPGLPFSNACHYRNDRVDELLEQSAVEIDTKKRVEMFKEFQQIVMRDVPDINLCMPVWLTISNSKLKDHSVTADGMEGNLSHAYFEA
jgi:peptide/nickel transport system substrate-binding protein